MKDITITVELANAIVAYLGTRPYQEVFQMIAALQESAQSQKTASEVGNE